ncbi:5590_t:CDS:10 [Acaulospora colombiana]|uniref:5590_t:CDS:1 n=1 Tax=Acaulospora colombiana TaxID=27376 RepID=A0ACA9KKE1_9GLOM|nr:5590_t:CDS:10 [Acaulospora colombiana]
MEPDSKLHESIKSPEEIVPASYQCYLNDLITIPPARIPPSSIFYPTVTFFSFIRNMFVHLLFTLSTDLTMPISRPLNFLAVVVLYPLCILILLPFDIFLRVFNFLWLGKNIKLYDENIWQKIPRSDLSLKKIRENGIELLGQPPPDQDSILTQSPTFNLDMAETILFLCTIIYQRDVNTVYDAYKILQERDFDFDKVTFEDWKEVNRLLNYSVQEIRRYAHEWELEFQPLSELGSLATNFTEWLTDFLFSRIDARSFVFGEIHGGFYNCLFPEDNYTTSRVFGSYPSRRIVEAVREKAREIAMADREDDGDDNDAEEKIRRVNVWVAGHSLGAALAQVFYARLVKTSDLGRYAVMRDAFVFAGPAVGDNNFFSGFNSYLNISFCENRTLWRVIDDNDIVPTLPPMPSDPRIRQYLEKNDVFNYFHIGDAVKFYQYDRKPESHRDIFGKIKDVSQINRNIRSLVPRKSGGKNDYNVKMFGPLESLLPSPIRNHMPHRYFSAMERSRDYFEKHSFYWELIMSGVSALLSPFSDELQQGINNHIHCELQASFVLLLLWRTHRVGKNTRSMVLNNIFNVLQLKYECLADANAFMQYQCQRGGKVELKEIDAPELCWDDPIETFEKVLALEKCISEDLYKLDAIAEKCGDKATCNFIEGGFLDKETCHVKTTADMLRQIKRVQGEGSGLYNIDRELRKNEGRPVWSNKAMDIQAAFLDFKLRG